MSKQIVISIDAMGGDEGHMTVVPAAILALKRHAHLTLILVGDTAVLEPIIKRKCPKNIRDRLILHHASQVVEMDDSPSQALRSKKDSSMRVAINLVKEGKSEACVSAGNTGALMATARFVLKTLPGIDRPAIIGLIPAQNELKRVRVLDLGANVDSSADQLFQFAVMGSVLTSAVDELDSPKVALLNIGEEEIKGNDQVKLASRMLSDSDSINYIGYVEGSDIFKGVADVIVCDGFVGNVALKTTEGLAKYITRLIKQAFKKNILTRLAGLLAIFVLKGLKKNLDPARYNGASLVGLRGIVVKSHGHTSVKGYAQAIEWAMLEVDHNVPSLIEGKVAAYLDYDSPSE